MQEALDRVKREMPPSIAESEILGFFLNFFKFLLIFRIFGFCSFQTRKYKAGIDYN